MGEWFLITSRWWIARAWSLRRELELLVQLGEVNEDKEAKKSEERKEKAKPSKKD